MPERFEYVEGDGGQCDCPDCRSRRGEISTEEAASYYYGAAILSTPVDPSPLPSPYPTLAGFVRTTDVGRFTSSPRAFQWGADILPEPSPVAPVVAPNVEPRRCQVCAGAEGEQGSEDEAPRYMTTAYYPGEGEVCVCEDCCESSNRIVELMDGYRAMLEVGRFYCESCRNSVTTAALARDNTTGSRGYLCRDCASENAEWNGSRNRIEWSSPEPDYDEESDGDEGAYSYDYHPSPLFYGVDKSGALAVHEPGKALHFGIELEMECNGNGDGYNVRRAVEAIKASGLPVYCKDDGSLNYGTEMVSQPLTLEAWQAVRERFGKLLAELRANGCRSYNTTTCGLHIHASRAAFDGTTHIYKLLTLLYQNPKFALLLSRRQSLDAMSQYASVTDTPIADLPRKARDGQDFSRYSAINLQNSATVEFRLFRGTLGLEGVYRAIETVCAMIEYSRSASIQEAGRPIAFRTFVGKRAKTYPNLAALLNGKPEASNEREIQTRSRY
jgi:hypothetical protein